MAANPGALSGHAALSPHPYPSSQSRLRAAINAPSTDDTGTRKVLSDRSTASAALATAGSIAGIWDIDAHFDSGSDYLMIWYLADDGSGTGLSGAQFLYQFALYGSHVGSTYLINDGPNGSYRWTITAVTSDNFSGTMALRQGITPVYVDAGTITGTRALPDLAAGNVSNVPSAIQPGSPFTPLLTITNDGRGTASGDEVTDFYLSPTPVLTASLPVLGTAGASLQLDQGRSISQSADLTIPQNTPPGTYYLIAKVNADNAVQEIDSPDGANDIAVSRPISIGLADLAVTSLSSVADMVMPSEPIMPRLSFANNGPGEAKGQETTEYYLSTTPDLSGKIQPALGTEGEAIDLQNGQASSEQPQLTIPQGTTTGKYYLVAELNADGSIPESDSADDTNNIIATSPFMVCGDAAPFALSGNFHADLPNSKCVATGTVQIGLKDLSPLVQMNGTVTFDASTIDANGVFSADFAGTWQPLFTGEVQFNIGAGTAALANEVLGSLPASYLPAGLAVKFDNIAFTPGGLELQGALTLPTALGGIQLSVAGGNKMVISSNGLAITGGAIQFPNTSFSLFGKIGVQASGLSASYTASTNDFKIHGMLAIPTLHNATFDLTDPNYLDVSPNGVSVQGTLSAADIQIVPGEWELKNVAVTVGPNVLRGSATMMLPGGVLVSASLGFVNGQFNSASLTGSNLNTLIGATGVYLQSIGGSVDHLADADPAPPEFSGSLGLTYGPEISLNLPALFGGRVSGSLVDVELSGTYDETEVTGEGTVKIAGGLVSGTVSANLNLEEHTLGLATNFSALGGVVASSTDFEVDAAGDLSGSGGAAVSIPLNSILPSFFTLNVQLGSGSFALQYQPTAPLSADYLEATGAITLPAPINRTWQVGVRVTFDGTTRTLGANNLPPANMPLPLLRSASTAASASQSFVVPPGADLVLFNGSWANVAANVPLVITAPDGRTYTNADFGTGAVALVTSLSGSNQTTVAVASPAPGSWTVAFPDTSSLGSVTFGGYESTPALMISVASSPVSGVRATIQYTDVAPDANARVSLYYAATATGLDGTLIAEGLSGPSGHYTWNTAGVKPGTYYIYARVDDGNSLPAFTYSTSTFKVFKPGDANGDGSVNFADLLILAQNYGSTNAVTWQSGDFDGDGTVGFDDLLVLAQSYGKTAAASADGVSLLSAKWQRQPARFRTTART